MTMLATMTAPSSFADATQGRRLSRNLRDGSKVTSHCEAEVIFVQAIKPSLNPVDFSVVITEHFGELDQNIFSERFPYHVRTYRRGMPLEAVGFDMLADARLYASIIADRVSEGRQEIWGA